MPDPKSIKQILEEMQAAGKLPPGTISVNSRGTGCITQILNDKDLQTTSSNTKPEIVSERKSHGFLNQN